MRVRTTIILAIIAAALGAVYVLLDVLPATRLPTAEERRAAGEFVFAGPSFRVGEGAGATRLRDLIARLTIERPSGKVSLERVSQPPEMKWRMREPIQTDAAPGEIGFLCYELESLKVKSVIRPAKSQAGDELPLDLAAYGLDKPQARVTFTVEKPAEPAKSWSLHLGKPDADGQALYVKRDDENVVYAVAPAILARLTKPLNELRDRAAVSINPETVAAIELTCAQPPLTVRCDLRKDGWHVTKPIADFAEEGRIGEILSDAAKLRIKPDDFISETDDDPGKYGLDKPRVTVSFAQKDETLALLLGNDVEGKRKVYAKRSDRPTIFALEKKDVAAFALDPIEIRSVWALRFNPDDVTAIDLDLPTARTAVKRSADSWKIESPVTLPADADQVNDFLSTLARLQVTGWVDDEKPDLPKYGLAIPVASVSLATRTDARVSLQFGAPVEGGFVFARRGDGGPLLRMKRDILDRLAPGYLAFVEKRLHVADGTLTSLTIERADGTYVCSLKDKVWQIVSPAMAPADPETLRSITWNLSFLSAEQFVEQQPKALAMYGLDKPTMKLTAAAEKASGDSKAPATKTLLVGKPSGEDAFFAMVQGSDAVFTVAKDALAPLQKPLFSRQVCRFDAGKVVSLIVESPGKRVRVQKQTGPNELRASWVKMPPEQGEADAAPIESLLATMGDLKADSVVAYTLDDAAKYGLDKPTLVVISQTGADKPCRLAIGAKTESGGYFAECGGPLVYSLRAADVDRLRLP